MPRLLASLAVFATTLKTQFIDPLAQIVIGPAALPFNPNYRHNTGLRQE